MAPASGHRRAEAFAAAKAVEPRGGVRRVVLDLNAHAGRSPRMAEAVDTVDREIASDLLGAAVHWRVVVTGG